MTAALSCQGVSKRYSRQDGQRSLVNAIRSIGDPSRRSHRDWVLRDIDFEVQQGDTLGIIGRNGAGKTTLLRLLSGISAPTKGSISTLGRIAPLIGVGVGFNMELTGRENVFVNGQLLGMSHRRVTQLFDEIVAFSEIEAYVDTPVKIYSSGMFLRLAFSVGIFCEPDIFILDEILAVGDMAFQLKCAEKLREMRTSGTTLVVVTHSMETLARMADRAIVLHRGQMRHDGDVITAISAYNAAVREDQQSESLSGDGVSRHSTLDLAVRTGSGDPTASVRPGERVRVDLTLTVHREVRDPIFFLRVYGEDGTGLFDVHTPPRPDGPLLRAGESLACSIDLDVRLLSGQYRLHASAFEAEQPVLVESESVYLTVRKMTAGVNGVVDLAPTVSVGGRPVQLPGADALRVSPH